MKRRARLLLHQAARLADASTLGADPRAEIARMCGEAERLLQERTQKLTDMERAGTHPATHHTEAAWGAGQGEPNHEFPRALRRTLLDLGVPRDLADQLVDTGEESLADQLVDIGEEGEGQKGGKKRKKGGRKGKKGKCEW